MRIRRKKHLEDRLENVKDVLIVPERDIVNVKLAVQDKKFYDFNKIFDNDNPVELEIGCGKGGFITQKALLNPNVNFVAVEMLENIIVMACELAQKNGLTNIRFLNSGAEYLPRYIKEKSISNIYLNFSPPFPKIGSESHRLTSDNFVKAYKSYLVAGGKIYQKTDDREFFEYSFSKFVEHGFDVVEISDKIVNNQIENVETEYEKMFKNKGLKINGLIATLKWI